MLKNGCRSFREAFEPGRPEGHTADCEVCRAWANEVASWSRLGADLPVPPELRDRLAGFSAKETEIGTPVCAEQIPQVPLPQGLAARLRRIPIEARRSPFRPQTIPRSGEMVAASLLFAVLLTLGLASRASSADRPNFASVVLNEVGKGWTRPLVAASEYILDGCLTANSSLESILRRFSTPTPEAQTRPEEKRASQSPPEKDPPSEGKENHNGNRPAR